MTASQVCITVSNSPNPPRVKMSYINTEKVLHCLHLDMYFSFFESQFVDVIYYLHFASLLFELNFALSNYLLHTITITNFSRKTGSTSTN